MKRTKSTVRQVVDGVINSPHGEVINRPKPAKKKSPFKNTLKKKNGKYNLGILIKRARAQAREYARRCDGAVPEMAAEHLYFGHRKKIENILLGQ